MGRTIYYTSATLDGYLADENDSLDWLFVHDIDPDGPLSYERFIAGVGAVVMGRTTYQWIHDQTNASGETWPYHMPAWVVTHADPMATGPGLDGADIRFAAGDVRPIHAAMTAAAGDKDIWVVGGGDLAAQFAEAGLLDEVLLSIAPVTLGAGRPLFPRPFDLELVTLERNRDFVCAGYRVVGPRTSDRNAGVT